MDRDPYNEETMRGAPPQSFDDSAMANEGGRAYTPQQFESPQHQYINQDQSAYGVGAGVRPEYATQQSYENVPPAVPQHMEQQYNQLQVPAYDGQSGVMDGANDRQPQQQQPTIAIYEQPQVQMDPNDPRYAAQTSNSRPTSGLSGSDKYSNMGQSTTYAEQNSRGSSTAAADAGRNKNSVVIKVGMVGDAQIGKTSLMVKYVEGSWDEDYIQTLGVNFMEKTISIRNTEITFSIWDLGGQREFVNMLPLVCNDAVAILFMFDLTRKSTLNSIKEWYRQGRGFNKTAIPVLVGTKYDTFVNFPREDQEEISNQVCETLCMSEARAWRSVDPMLWVSSHS